MMIVVIVVARNVATNKHPIKVEAAHTNKHKAPPAD